MPRDQFIYQSAPKVDTKTKPKKNPHENKSSKGDLGCSGYEYLGMKGMGSVGQVKVKKKCK